ncbi:MAG: MFS transporter [Armatimonadota bacterium]|nr:MFS transporter [Armatimonadota bacterium]MDR7550594.1 MFS transporter [Armatimonadota bacterium]
MDGRLILAARGIRTFAYGFQSVLLGVYLTEVGFAPWQVGGVLTATLVGSAALTALFAATADRYGRRRMLRISALCMAASGAAFASSTSYPLLILVSLTGTVGATSGEVGPFLSLEQAMLPQTASEARRTRLFSLYNLVGALAGSAGALSAGLPALLERWLGLGGPAAYRVMFLVYAGCAAIVLRLFGRLSGRVEVGTEGTAPGGAGGLRRSRRVVLRLAALFGLDSLAGGFVVQGLIAFYFHLRWGAGPELLGPIFLGVGLLQAASFLAAARVAERIGLINTMVFTHLPSNVLLMAIPLAPSLAWAVGLLLARHALSQMDVPARQSYVVAVVDPNERVAAAGVTNIARNVAQAVTPVIAGAAMQVAGLGVPFLLGGGLKIVYDLVLFAMFRHVRPPEERR